MNEENPNIPPFAKYRVNMDKEDLINIYIRKWVLKWCKEYHPEAFIEAEKFIRELANENN
jgi:hypothetical protein